MKKIKNKSDPNLKKKKREENHMDLKIMWNINGYENEKVFNSTFCNIKVSTLSIYLSQGKEQLTLPLSSIKKIGINNDLLDLSKCNILDASLKIMDYFEAKRITYE